LSADEGESAENALGAPGDRAGNGPGDDPGDGPGNSRGVLLVLAGTSGAGKGTIGARLREADPALGWSVSWTTRPRRAGEREGVDYHFVTREEFERLRDANGFLEWFEVYGDLKGTPLRYVTDELARGHDVMLGLPAASSSGGGSSAGGARPSRRSRSAWNGPRPRNGSAPSSSTPSSSTTTWVRPQPRSLLSWPTAAPAVPLRTETLLTETEGA
jgi:hypothetical protein